MQSENPRRVKGAGSAVDTPGLIRIPPETQREPFAINIIAGLWRGFDVTVSPPSAQHLMRHFGGHAEASAFAEELGRITSWPVRDRTASDG